MIMTITMHQIIVDHNNSRERPPALKFLKTTTKLRPELPTDIEIESIPLMKLPSSAEDIHDKTQEAS